MHSIMCHMSCPFPFEHLTFSLEKSLKIVKHLACHTWCGSDLECHKTSCANPWAELEAKCDLYWNVSRCHRACGEDRGCHYKCPRMSPHGRHHWHHMDDDGVSHEHGHWHHHAEEEHPHEHGHWHHHGEDENPHEHGHWHHHWHHSEEDGIPHAPGHWHRRWHHAEEKEAPVPAPALGEFVV